MKLLENQALQERGERDTGTETVADHGSGPVCFEERQAPVYLGFIQGLSPPNSAAPM